MAAVRPRWAPVLDAAGFVAFGAVATFVLRRLGPHFDTGTEVALVAAGFACGYFLADFSSGFAHWFCDTFFEEDTPVLGPLLILAFREHHRDPLKMTRHGVLELHGDSCIALTPVCASLLLVQPAAHPAVLFAYAAGIAFVGGNLLTTQFHKWAHDREPSLLARLLHRTGLILTPRHHSVHHAPPYQRYYCVTSGWANAILERLRFWERAERFLVALGLPRSRDIAPPAGGKPDRAAA